MFTMLMVAIFWASGFAAGYVVRELMSRRRHAAARKKFYDKVEMKKVDSHEYDLAAAASLHHPADKHPAG
jgi:hypothetical protein